MTTIFACSFCNDETAPLAYKIKDDGMAAICERCCDKYYEHFEQFKDSSAYLNNTPLYYNQTGLGRLLAAAHSYDEVEPILLDKMNAGIKQNMDQIKKENPILVPLLYATIWYCTAAMILLEFCLYIKG